VQKCAAAYRDVAGPASAALLVHSIASASLGHFLSTRGDALHPKQFEKTFNYMAHSFAYWGRRSSKPAHWRRVPCCWA